MHLQGRTIQNHYDDQVIAWLEHKGRLLFGNHFRILPADHSIVMRLWAWFRRDEETCNAFGIDIGKGILLAGPVGCGKTSLMTLMKYVAPTGYKHIIKPCRDISFEFIDGGYKVLHTYSKGKLNESLPRAYCFDDLGIENNLKYFGNECNVMTEILLSRYDLFVSRRIPTHITTNLSASEIEKYYGPRVRSRLREMVNLIAFSSTTPDKR